MTYNPNTDGALLLENMNGGPVRMLLVDEADSVSLTLHLEIEGMTTEMEIRLHPDAVTRVQERLADIRTVREW